MPPNWGLNSKRDNVAVTTDGTSQGIRNRLVINPLPFNGRFRRRASEKPIRNDINVETNTYLKVSNQDLRYKGSRITLM